MRTHKKTPWYEEYFGIDYLLIDIQKNTSKEVSFLRKILHLRKNTKLLDVACGYGRHLTPLVRSGIDVVGCDLSLFMLGETRKQIGNRIKENQLVNCDMKNLPFAQVFDCACNMFNSFGYFEEEEDNFRVLTSIAGVLKPGGLFLLDLVNRDFVIRSLSRKDWFLKNGAVILERKYLDSVKNRTEIDVSIIDRKGKRDYHHSIRIYTFTEISMLLEAAGFRVLSVFGGFDGEEFDWNHDRMLILTQKLKMEN